MHLGLRLILALPTLMAIVRVAEAQEDPPASVEESLACFVETLHAPDCEDGVVSVEEIVLQPDQYPGLYEAALDGLVRLAATSDGLYLRTRARVWLGAAGAAGGSGVVWRLMEIYRHAEKPATRSGIAMEMSRQRDTAAAVEALAEIARDQRPGDVSDEFPLALIAISTLEYMGPQGHIALQRLRAEGQIQNPLARTYLKESAERGFRPKETGKQP